jgi:hypothetical protein
LQKIINRVLAEADEINSLPVDPFSNNVDMFAFVPVVGVVDQAEQMCCLVKQEVSKRSYYGLWLLKIQLASR